MNLWCYSGVTVEKHPINALHYCFLWYKSGMGEHCHQITGVPLKTGHALFSPEAH